MSEFDPTQIPPELIAEINGVEMTMHDGEKYPTIEKQIIVEYYDSLPEISIDDLSHANRIDYICNNEIVSLHVLGSTPVGPLCTLEVDGRDSTEEGVLFIVTGSIFAFDEIHNCEKKVFDTIKEEVFKPYDNTQWRFEIFKNKFAIMSRALCQDSSLILLPAYFLDGLPRQTDTGSTVISTMNNYRHCCIVLSQSDELVDLFIDPTPKFTDGIVHDMDVVYEKENVQYMKRIR